MSSNQSGFVSGVVACLVLAFGGVVACGSSTSSSPDGSGGEHSNGGSSSQGGHAGKGGNSRAGEAGSPNEAGGSEQGGEGGAAGSDAGAGGEAGASMPVAQCTVASFDHDCPEKACNLVSGCLDGVCQYTPVAVCVNRLGIGTFAPAAADLTVGNLTLHGSIGAFRASDGMVCRSTTCITGGVTP